MSRCATKIYIPQTLKQRLDIIHRKTNLPYSQIIEQLLRQAMEQEKENLRVNRGHGDTGTLHFASERV